MNFTWRARSLLVLAAAGLAVGLLLRQEPVALSSLTVLIWLGLEWANFRLRTLAAEAAFSPRQRLVDGRARNSLVLVVDQEAAVEWEVHVAPKLAGLRCWIEDVVPGGCLVVDGSPALVADLRGRESFRCRYVLRPTITGHLALPGLQLVLGDPQGLFRLQRFLPLRQELAVLPFLVRPQATASVLKPQNVQVLPGTHRHRAAGFSTELLGIRDYRSGDPPRSIAWKATARRGRLMTCEYESETPVRATIIADLSPAQFVGRPGPAAADRVISASASLARLLLSDHDPVAGLLVAAAGPTWLPHGLGERHLSRWLLRLLSVTAPPPVDALSLDVVTRLAWTCGVRRFPELFDRAVNPPRARWFPWGGRGRLARRRQRLSFALAALYDGTADLPARLQIDDRLYRGSCRRLLSEHPDMADAAALPADPAALWDGRRKAVDAICRGLLAGVTRARDNELFVIVGTPPLEPASLGRLEDAVRVARAAYHRVVVIDVGAAAMAAGFEEAAAQRILAECDRHSATEQWTELERRLGRLGGKVARLDDPRLMEKVAAEVELLRTGRARMTRGGR